MFNGAYGSRLGIASVLSIIYIGVVVSDMITFGLGAALRAGVLNAKSVKILSGDGFKRAVAQIQRWGRWIGTVQRFSLGFRGPLCLVCGFTGVSPRLFASGVAVGAVGTMALQLAAGYLLRTTPNAYLAALALVSGPNLVGHIAGPLATAFSFWWAGKQGRRSQPDSDVAEESAPALTPPPYGPQTQ